MSDHDDNNNNNPLNKSRRDFVLQTLAAAGGIGLRSFLIGVPGTFITRRAMAAGQPTFLIYSCYAQGCPLNANVPGAYVSGVTHPGSFATPVSFNLGNVAVQAAQPWANLPLALRNRMQFIHHHTQTNGHSEAENVMKVQGALKAFTGSGQEMLPSAIAQINRNALGTLSSAPILLGKIDANLTFNSVPQPLIGPGSLKNIFPSVITATTKSLQQFRDKAIDELYRDLKTNGTSAQRDFLDDHAISANQARSLAVEFQNTLSGLGTVSYANDEMIAAAALIAANVTPSIVIGLRFGGDNHGSSGMEVQQTTESTAAMAFLWDRLNSMGLADKTTFCVQNVFGRTLTASASGGRQHWGAHSVAVLFGPNVKPGVTGEVSMAVRNGTSTAINSTTGKAANADVAQDETLAATAKTVMKACGIQEPTIDVRITKGKILRSAVV